MKKIVLIVIIGLVMVLVMGCVGLVFSNSLDEFCVVKKVLLVVLLDYSLRLLEVGQFELFEVDEICVGMVLVFGVDIGQNVSLVECVLVVVVGVNVVSLIIC